MDSYGDTTIELAETASESKTKADETENESKPKKKKKKRKYANNFCLITLYAVSVDLAKTILMISFLGIMCFRKMIQFF